MKSVVLPALIAVASVLTIGSVFAFSLAYQSETVVRNIKERSVIDAINQVEFIKRALHQAVDYSVYQSAYEISKHGGYESNCNPKSVKTCPETPQNERGCPGKDEWRYNSISDVCMRATFDRKCGIITTETTSPISTPYWRINENICFPGNFYEILKQKTKEIFTSYLEAIDNKLKGTNLKVPTCQSGYLLSKGECRAREIGPNECIAYETTCQPPNCMYIPCTTPLLYTDVQIKISDNSAEVLFKTDKKINFKSKDLEISDNGNIKENVKTELGNLLDLGKKSFVEKDSIKDSVAKASSSMSDVNGKNCREIKVGDSCGLLPDAYSTLTTQCGNNIEDVFKERVNSNVLSISNEKLKVTIKNILPIESSNKFVSGSCNYEKSTCQVEDNPCASKQCPSDSQKGYTSWGYEGKRDLCVRFPVDEKLQLGPEETASPTCVPSYKTVDAYNNIVCTYDYKASANALVRVTSKNTYPVYDAVEKKPNLRNLELQFYIFSGNQIRKDIPTTPSTFPGTSVKNSGEITGGPLGDKFVAYRLETETKDNEIIFHVSMINVKTGESTGTSFGFNKNTEKSLLDTTRQNVLQKLKTDPDNTILLLELVAVEWAIDTLYP